MPRSIYTRLTPRNRTLGGHTQLWLAPDHLLLLTSTRFVEQYQRFSFADIQSIVVTQLPSQPVLQVVMILAALAWMSFWFVVDSRFAKWAFEITGAVALLLSIADIARGPRCRCFLRTRVSGQLLAPVSRIATARKFLAAVRPRIEAAQGVLESLPAIETAQPSPPPELVSSPGYVPEILFATFLVNAVLIWAYGRFPRVPDIAGVLMNTVFAELVLIVVALVRRKGRDSRAVIYVVVVLSLAGLAFDAVTIGSELIVWYMKVLEKAKTGDKSITPLTFLPTGGTRIAVACAWRSVAGIFGLAAAFYERRKP